MMGTANSTSTDISAGFHWAVRSRGKRGAKRRKGGEKGRDERNGRKTTPFCNSSGIKFQGTSLHSVLGCDKTQQ